MPMDAQPPSTLERDGYVRLLDLADCPLNQGAFVEIADRELAVFRLSEPERVFVIDNACPHANGNLSAGDVQRGVVQCPWHGWRFHLCDGRSADGGVARVPTYPVQVQDGTIYVRL